MYDSDLAVLNEISEKHGIPVACHKPENDDVYIKLKDLTDWMVEKYGTSTGAVNATIFEILAHIQQLDKVKLGEVERNG